MSLKDLLVSDTPRKSSQEYFEKNGISEIERLPEVWKTNIGNVISDGNNRAYFLAKEGESEMLVKYRGELTPFGYNHTTIVDDAENLQKMGIRTVYDLVSGMESQ